eukprot:gene295-6709_t
MDKYRGRFYSAIGVNKGISSKKLDTILHENHVEKTTIVSFLENQAIPGEHIHVIWKIFLGVLPKHRESWSFIEKQAEEEYEDLLNACFCSKETKRSQEIIEVVSFCERLKCWKDSKKKCTYPDFYKNVLIKSLCSVFEKNYEVYWCYNAMLEKYKFDQENWKIKIEEWKIKLKEYTKDIKLDEETLDEIFESWFASLFVRHTNLFIVKRLWGIIFISDDNFIVSIAKSFIYFLRPKILSNPNEAKKILITCLKEVDIENVITKAIEFNKK